jgi:hypothetical protein
VFELYLRRYLTSVLWWSFPLEIVTIILVGVFPVSLNFDVIRPASLDTVVDSDLSGAESSHDGVAHWVEVLVFTCSLSLELSEGLNLDIPGAAAPSVAHRLRYALHLALDFDPDTGSTLLLPEPCRRARFLV